MGYYRGDYYRGDYYRGGIGDFLKKAVKVVGGAVGGFVGGGPIGAITGAVGAIATPSRPVPQVPASPVIAGQGMLPISTAIKVGSKILTGVGVVEAAKGIGQAVGLFNGAGTGKRRTMNHLNPKALSRATRRVEGFVKKARKAVSPLGYSVVRRGSARCAPKPRKCR